MWFGIYLGWSLVPNKLQLGVRWFKLVPKLSLDLANPIQNPRIQPKWTFDRNLILVQFGLNLWRLKNSKWVFVGYLTTYRSVYLNQNTSHMTFTTSSGQPKITWRVSPNFYQIEAPKSDQKSPKHIKMPHPKPSRTHRSGQVDPGSAHMDPRSIPDCGPNGVDMRAFLSPSDFAI